MDLTAYLTTHGHHSPGALTSSINNGKRDLWNFLKAVQPNFLTLFDQRLLTKDCQKYFRVHKLLIKIDKEHLII
jgi:hypothetical protein